MARYFRTAEELSTKADFLVIYIEEAHASGEFDFGTNPLQFSQHDSLSERIDAAKQMVETLGGKAPCPVLVDNMHNDAMYDYGARPERLYILLNGKVVYQARRGPLTNDPDEFYQRLDELCH
jgi:type I thyroxine 5'-deiodinase